MNICGYHITLSGATVLLATFTAVSAIFTAIAARHTKKLAQYNKDIITQSEKQHRESLRPLCFPMTQKNNVIYFNKVITVGALRSNLGPGTSPRIKVRFCNKGLGPAINLRFHINNIHNQRITKDFMVAHALPPNGVYDFISEIPLLKMNGINGNLVFEMPPGQVVHDAYSIVCEYNSMFSGEVFHSIVAKGYRDPALAGDGENSWRLNRPLTPPVEFKPGLDPAKPIWPLPPEDANYPAEFLNFSSPPENGQSN
jgi:hypothetical protein